MFKKIQLEKREAAIKKQLLNRIKDAVQSLVQPGIPKISKGPTLGHTDNTNALCSSLEAVLIHGLRDSLGERFSSLLADPDRMPIPNFWPVVLTMSHRDLIQQVSQLSFITSEVGKGRAWIRLALNQGQLLSYLTVLMQDETTLKDYYKSTAFVRDCEYPDMMIRVLQPIASIPFNFATNAAVLNTWTQTPLVLAGVWIRSGAQDYVSEPVLEGTDVASTFVDQGMEGMDIPSVETPIYDQMFDIIMSGTPETSFISDNIENKEKPEAEWGEEEQEKQKEEEEVVKFKAAQNKHVSQGQVEHDGGGVINTGDIQAVHCDKEIRSSAKNDDSGKQEQKGSDETEVQEASGPLEELEESKKWVHRSLSVTLSVSDDGSSLLNSWNQDVPEYKSLFSALEAPQESVPPSIVSIAALPSIQVGTTGQSDKEASRHTRTDSLVSPGELEELNYEVLPRHHHSVDELLKPASLFSDTTKLLPNYLRITTEEGLDAQQYKCYQCQSYIGMIYGQARLCVYDSHYYCCHCHDGEEMVIPSRVVGNWDMRTHPVCTQTGNWLLSMQNQPLVDVRTANPKLYTHVDQMAEMQLLRTQLLYIRAYIFTCNTETVPQQLRRMVWPREYLYEHVHLYSINDLVLVNTGQLVTLLRHVVKWGKTHIFKCSMCSSRGFYCELCKESDIIYPFQLGLAYTCGKCSGVYHTSCAKSWQECPRCARRKARQLTQDRDAPH
ncbi:pleckstrin homology and RUN domain containing M1 isoform X2 [Oratosquilla oratoria]|uniref:pleckstrin homology and RUN domain containing M1 isoform X2 n=1 Tax=Oratosquilla oratoria TaxID=337810 RepID=UPI003F76A578